MPSWVFEAFGQLRAAMPVAYAAMTYGIFHYLDKNASASAKKAIKSWIKPLDYDKAAVADAIVDVFDRVYSKPLFHWRAFVRSAAFSLLVISIFLFENSLTPIAFASLQKVIETEHPEAKLLIAFLSAGFLSNIVSDYISIFAVRSWLLAAKMSPMLYLLAGPLVGCYTVALVYLIRDIPFFIILDRQRDLHLLSDGYFPLGWIRFFIFGVTHQNVWTSHWLFLPALAVHSWLILFAVSVILVRLGNLLIAGVSGVQWFLKRGDQHPLDAIGCVAAAIVFIIASVARMSVATSGS